MKMSRKTRIIGLSAILALLVVGAGVLSWKLLAPETDVPDAPTVEGVAEQIYTETLLKEAPDDHCDIIRMGDRIVARVGANADLVDINTWESAYTWPTSWTEQGLDIKLIAFDSENNIYGLVYSEETNQVSVVKHYAGAKPEETIILQNVHAEAKEGSRRIKTMMVDDEYIYLGIYDGGQWQGVQVFTHDGAPYAEYSDIKDFDINNKGAIYLLHGTDKDVPISCREVKTDELIYKFMATQSTGGGNQIFLERNSGLICLRTRNEVTTYKAEDGSYVKTIMENAKSAPSLGSNPGCMLVDSALNIYILDYTLDGDNVIAKFYKCFLQDNSRLDMPYTLTVEAPYRDDYFARVIAKFEQENPKEKIEYKYTYNSLTEFGQNADDDGYFDKLKLKLLTGDIGDVVMVGNVYNDMHQLLTRGIFEDLKPRVEKDASFKELDKKMLDGITINGEMRTLPLSATHRYMQVNETVCQELGIKLDWENATWGEILDLAKNLEGTDKYLFSAPEKITESIFVRMNISNMPELINMDTSEINLRQPWFLELIEKWKTASKLPNFSVSSEVTDGFGIAPNALINTFRNTGYRADEDMLYDGVLNSKNDSSIDVRQYPLPKGEKNANHTSWSEDMYSISSVSKNKEAAWQLLSLAMNEEMQSMGAMRNRALNMSAREKSMKTAEQSSIESAPGLSTQIKTFYNDIRKVYSNVDYMYDMGKLKEHLFYPLLDYIDGKITLDEALKKAERDIILWFNE